MKNINNTNRTIGIIISKLFPNIQPIVDANPTPDGIFLVITIENIEKQCPRTAKLPMKGPNKIVGIKALRVSSKPLNKNKEIATVLEYFSAIA